MPRGWQVGAVVVLAVAGLVAAAVWPPDADEPRPRPVAPKPRVREPIDDAELIRIVCRSPVRRPGFPADRFARTALTPPQLEGLRALLRDPARSTCWTHTLLALGWAGERRDADEILGFLAQDGLALLDAGANPYEMSMALTAAVWAIADLLTHHPDAQVALDFLKACTRAETWERRFRQGLLRGTERSPAARRLRAGSQALLCITAWGLTEHPEAEGVLAAITSESEDRADVEAARDAQRRLAALREARGRGQQTARD